MSDLVERLLKGAVFSDDGRGNTEAILTPTMREAAARITALEADVQRLRDIVVRYGDRIGMANAPAELQQTIDDAFSRAALAEGEG